VTYLDRNFGNILVANATWTVGRSTGSFGTGTTIVVGIISNTTWNTPSGWTQRFNNVSSMGIYLFDKTAAGETTINFTTGSAGAGQWYAWELSAGSTYVGGSATEAAGAADNMTTPNVTPTAGPRHLLAVIGGNRGSTGVLDTFNNSFTRWNGAWSGGGDGTLSAAADRDVTADGVTAYNTTGTMQTSAQIVPRAALIAAYVDNAGDTTPPTVPTGLATTAVGSTTADFSWTASTDAVGVTGYEIQVIGQ
jgi:hypothetical protein